MFFYTEGVTPTTEDTPPSSRWQQRLCRWFGHHKLLRRSISSAGEERVLEWQCKRCLLRTLSIGIDGMTWYEYIRKHYLCQNCKMPLVQHQEGKCLFHPTHFAIEEYLVHQHLLQQGEDASMENVRLQKARIEADFRRGVL